MEENELNFFVTELSGSVFDTFFFSSPFSSSSIFLMTIDFRGLYTPSTPSYWLNGAPWQEPSKAALPDTADIVIVGGMQTILRLQAKNLVVCTDAKDFSWYDRTLHRLLVKAL